MNSLDVDVRVDTGGLHVRAAFSVPAAARIAVLGPNGAGKSTLLRAIAGLGPRDIGTVRLGEHQLDGPGIWVRPDRRGVTLLDQKPRLFPHLDAAQNIAFGPRARGESKARSAAIADKWLRRFELADRGQAKAGELSGGQQQRVAIARACAAEPRLMLLDEPFSALDAASVPSVRAHLAEHLQNTSTTSILVTHELADAWQWSTRCLVIDGGRIVADTSPEEIAERPSHPFTAALAGFGVVRGCWSPDGVVVADRILQATAGGTLAPGDAAFAVVAPGAVEVVAPGTGGAVPGVVEDISLNAGKARIRHSSGLISDHDPRSGGIPSAGSTIWLRPHGLTAYPPPPGGAATARIRR